jgi:dihydropteroate synthase
MPGRNPPDVNDTVSHFSPLAPLLTRPSVDLNTRHGQINLSGRSAVMGVLNVTPDSFFDGGRHFDLSKAIAAGVVMAGSGADIIDIGGESTRPGAQTVSETDELARVLPVIHGLRKEISLPISIDTCKSAVARAALDAGADIINDISALRFDASMVELAARENVPVILMHMQGTPQTMQKDPQYTDVVRDVRDFLAAQLYEAMEAGIMAESLVLDPGIGFGKTLDHNLQLLRGLPVLAALGQPLLVGVSRKAFIGKLLNLTANERLEGSLAAAVVAALNGANILRVHDVAETSRALRIADAIRFGAK